MTDHTTIREICSRLDPEDETHWTSQGLPRMDVLAGMGLAVERRELNEALPGFNRAKAGEARAATVAAASADPAQAVSSEQPGFFLQAKARAERRKAALQHLAAGGFTMKDLEPVRCRLERSTSARNRQTRRELGTH